jgi:hypothetical protein
MQKFLMCALLALTAMASAGESSDKQQQAGQAVEAWQHDFYLHLLNHNNPELQAYGVMFLSPSTQQPPQSSIEQQVAPVLYALAQNAELSHHAIWLITDLCLSELVYKDCNISRLMEHMVTAYGDELTTYLPMIRSALSADIESEVVEWLSRMSVLPGYQLHKDISSSLVTALNEYVILNPLPVEHLDGYLGMGSFMNEDDFTSDELKNLHEHANEYMLLLIRIKLSLSMPVPAFKSVIDACEQYPKLHTQCLQTGKLLVTDDGHYLNLAVGYQLQSLALRHAGETAQAEQAQQKLQAVKAEVNCLSRWAQYPVLPKMNLELMNENLEVKRTRGDRAARLHYAKKNHASELSKGNANEGDGPEQCLYDKASWES